MAQVDEADVPDANGAWAIRNTIEAGGRISFLRCCPILWPLS